MNNNEPKENKINEEKLSEEEDDVVIEDNNEDEQIHLHSKETRDIQGCGIRYSRRNLVMPIFVFFFVKTLLLLRFQSSDRDQMKDMKILHSMANLDF